MTTPTEKQLHDAELLDIIRRIARGTGATIRFTRSGVRIQKGTADAELTAALLRIKEIEEALAFAEKSVSAGIAAEVDLRSRVRLDTSISIGAAINFGYENTQRPLTEDHWLMEFWMYGRRCGEADELAKSVSGEEVDDRPPPPSPLAGSIAPLSKSAVMSVVMEKFGWSQVNNENTLLKIARAIEEAHGISFRE